MTEAWHDVCDQDVEEIISWICVVTSDSSNSFSYLGRNRIRLSQPNPHQHFVTVGFSRNRDSVALV